MLTEEHSKENDESIVLMIKTGLLIIHSSWKTDKIESDRKLLVSISSTKLKVSERKQVKNAIWICALWTKRGSCYFWWIKLYNRQFSSNYKFQTQWKWKDDIIIGLDPQNFWEWKASLVYLFWMEELLLLSKMLVLVFGQMYQDSRVTNWFSLTWHRIVFLVLNEKLCCLHSD